MSGPYDCLTCGGNRWYPASEEEDGNLETIVCPDCKGSGDRWLECVFSPSQEDRELGRVEYVDGAWRFKEEVKP